MIPLQKLNRQQFEDLKKIGMLRTLYPEAPNTFETIPRLENLTRFIDQLTERELQVFRCIGLGMTTEEITHHEGFSCSPKTVSAFKESIKWKLCLKHGSQLATAATLYVHGLIKK